MYNIYNSNVLVATTDDRDEAIRIAIRYGKSARVGGCWSAADASAFVAAKVSY